MNEIWKCRDCDFTGPVGQWETQEVYPESEWEPSDWETVCPCCGLSWEFAEVEEDDGSS